MLSVCSCRCRGILFGNLRGSCLELVEAGEILASQEVIDAAEILAHLTVAEFIDLVDESVKEITVMAHHDNRSGEVAYRFLKNILRGYVKMVCGFVENQEIDRFEKQTDHGVSSLLPTALSLSCPLPRRRT